MRSEEMNTESPKEMDNLVAALECADSLGVDIFSVSLGYAYFDNTDWSLSKSAMDGKTTRCSRAALIAARKGMLVVVSSGNEGDSEWQTVSAPADADSILTVGAVDTLRNIASFSSYGITTDGRIKPDVCAVGKRTTLISPWSGEVFNGNGTSFATPLMAGMAACIWSALPEEDAMSIRQRIITSADRYTQPEERYGYGIPDAYAAYSNILGITNASESKTATKSIRDNRLLILQNGTWYDVLGRVVKTDEK
jgi:subtilisin family serine protease